MTVLVTGVPGWIGTELIAQLDNHREDVRCLVYNETETGELDNYDVEIVRGDITDLESLETVFSEEIDVIFHCAGINHPSYWRGVSSIFEVNTGGTKKLLETGRKYGINRFIYISSIMAQGFNHTREEEWTEDTICSPDTVYGHSKLQAEQHIRVYSRDYGIDYTIVRPCWYYGPRQPPRMTKLMKSIQDGRPIMFGDGTNRRSMMYVPSLADLLIKIFNRPDVTRNEIYNAADKHVYTTNQIYETIASYLDIKTIRPRRFTSPVPDILGVVQRTLERIDIHIREFHVAWEMAQNISCDSSKAMDELSWNPPSNLNPGMKKSIEWARDNHRLS